MRFSLALCSWGRRTRIILNDTRSSNESFVCCEPALDGLRAISVIAVIIYHAGFTWLGGGFLGVEVFFVVSGFLITSLLIGEHRSQGSINLREFWIRRARRLLPALVAMLAVIGLWVIFFGHQHVAAFRRDALPGIFYFSNWWQIFASDIPYFGLANPPLLRQVAAANAATTTFIEGPDGWCADEKIATDLSLRYDGLHRYRQGANYIFETSSPALLRVPSLR